MELLKLRLRQDERGASMVEYALLLALIAVAAVTAITMFGNGVATKYSSISSEVSNTPGG